MNILVLCGLFVILGFAAGSPEPQQQYRESLHPYYYGYPGQTPYVYRPSLEDDDEESAPSNLHDTRSRQVGAAEETLPILQTGSSDSSKVQQNRPENSPVKVVKPGVVDPPAFPPKRPPPTVKPETKEKEKVTDEDEDEEDEDDEENSQEDEDEDQDEEDEDEEERRRKESVKETLAANVNATTVVDGVASVNQTEVPVVPAVAVPEKVVVTKSKSKTTKPVKSTVTVSGDKLTKNKIKNKVVVVAPEDVSEENTNTNSDGVEALVPGYVTDQGEVLVPVDTVTGDSPISILPDPYSPVARGVPLTNNFPVPVTGRYGFRQGEVFGLEDNDDDDVTLEDEEDDDADTDADDDDEEDEEEDEAVKKPVKEPKKPPQKIPLALIPARAPTNEDDELEKEAAKQRFRSAGLPGYYGQRPQFSVDTRRFPPSRTPTLYPITFKINGGFLTGPFNEPVESSEVSQYIQTAPRRPVPVPQVQPQIVRRVPVRRPVAAPVSYNPNVNPFYSYYGGQFGPSSSEEQGQVQVRVQQQRPLVRRPYRPAYYSSPAVQSYPGYGPGYQNQVRLYTRRPYFNPRPQSYNLNQSPINVDQFLPARKTLAKLRNPGDRLKISSSYELLVEPPTYNRIRTKPRRPSNKNKRPVVLKSPVLKQQVNKNKRPVKIIPGKFVAQPVVAQLKQQQQEQAPVFYRPVYNVEPHQRVTVSGSFYRPGGQGPIPVPQQVGYQSSPNYYNGYREFIKGLLSGYYTGPGTGQPTPVIKMKNDLPVPSSLASGSSSTSTSDESSASSSASSETILYKSPVNEATSSSSSLATKASRAERNSRKSRLDQIKRKKMSKKVKKAKKVRDPLNILKKINNKRNM